MLSYLVTTDGGKRMSEIYDIAILGAGPAGISAAIYAARAKMNILWLDKQFAHAVAGIDKARKLGGGAVAAGHREVAGGRTGT